MIRISEGFDLMTKRVSKRNQQSVMFDVLVVQGTSHFEIKTVPDHDKWSVVTGVAVPFAKLIRPDNRRIIQQ